MYDIRMSYTYTTYYVLSEFALSIHITYNKYISANGSLLIVFDIIFGRTKSWAEMFTFFLQSDISVTFLLKYNMLKGENVII